MTAENSPKDLLTIERKASAYSAKRKVLRAVWNDVPIYSNTAFGDLVTQFKSGVDVGSDVFFEKNRDIIIESLDALKATAKTGFIETAYDALDEAITTSPDKATTIPLFPQAADVTGQQTLFDVYSYLQTALKKELADCQTAARLALISGIIEEPDVFARLGLFHHVPGIDIKSIVIKPDEYTFRAPTTIKGVEVRVIHPKDIESPSKTSLISNPLRF